MASKMIQIDQEKCVGCGACANACHQSAIGLVNGKATLLREDYCDGLGRCLPNCPVGAIQLVDRPALTEDQKKNQLKKEIAAKMPAMGGCPGSQSRTLSPESAPAVPPAGGCPGSRMQSLDREPAPQAAAEPTAAPAVISSSLRQWPVQIKLVPVNAPYFDGAKLLIAADCAAYAHGDFHRHFMKGKITIIGCPKLDEGDYADKLTEILAQNNIKSVTVVRMEVPCCGGIERAVRTALQNCGKMIPWQVVTLGVDGDVQDD